MACMKHALAMLWLFLPLVCTAAASTQSRPPIHHCVDAQGHQVFTDKSCASLDATPAPAVTRTNPAVPVAPNAQPAPGNLSCPTQRNALKQRVATAFRQHDTNLMAGLMLWRGYSTAGAEQHLRRLHKLLDKPFRGFQDDSDRDTPQSPPGLPPLVPADASSTPDPHTLTIMLAGPQTPNVSFPVTDRAGCLWLQPSQ